MGWQKWHLTTSGYIKRFKTNNAGSENYPRHKYKHLIGNNVEMQRFLDRLNWKAEEAAKNKLRIDNAFIEEKQLKRFHKRLRSSYKNPKNGTYEYNSFMRYGIKMLQDNFGPNPSDWKKREQEWARLLIKKGLSKRVIKQAVEWVNLFFKYTNDKEPDFPLLKFSPFEHNELDRYETKRLKKKSIKGERDPYGYFISLKDRKTILKNAPEKYKGFLNLLDSYGLRFSEALALKLVEGVLFDDVLVVKSQLDSVGGRNLVSDAVLTPVKSDRKGDGIEREIPHWKVDSLDEVLEWIESLPYEHPDTVNSKVNKYINGLFEKGLIAKPFRLHDYRRTFITSLLEEEGIHEYEVQKACGHSDIKTTRGYIREMPKKRRKLK
jgi:integrase